MHSLGLAESLILSVLLSISLQAAFLLESIPIKMLSDSIFPEHPSFATYFLQYSCPACSMCYLRNLSGSHPSSKQKAVDKHQSHPYVLSHSNKETSCSQERFFSRQQ